MGADSQVDGWTTYLHNHQYRNTSFRTLHAGATRNEGYLSQMDEETAPPAVAAGFKSYIRIFTYLDHQGRLLDALAFAAAVAAGSALPLMNLVFGKFVTIFNNFAIGRLDPEQYMSQVSKYASVCPKYLWYNSEEQLTLSGRLYFVYLFVAKLVLTYIHSVAVSLAAIRATSALRLDFMRSLLRQPISFSDTQQHGSAVKVTANGNTVTNGIAEKLSVLVQSCSTFVAAFAVAFAVQWKLTLITMSVVPTIIIVTAICLSIEVKSEDKIFAILGRSSVWAEQVFSSISTVHAFWLQRLMTERYDAYLSEIERVGRKKSPNYGVLFSVEFFSVYSGYALAFWQGIRMFARGDITEPGDIVT